MMTLSGQAYKQLQLISADRGIDSEDELKVVQMDKSSIYFHFMAYGKYLQMFTVCRTPGGKVKSGSVRFYE